MTALAIVLLGIGAGGALGGFYAHKKSRKRYVQLSVQTLKRRLAV